MRHELYLAAFSHALTSGIWFSGRQENIMLHFCITFFYECRGCKFKVLNKYILYFVSCSVLLLKVKRKEISFEVTLKSHFWPLQPFFPDPQQILFQVARIFSISNYNIKSKAFKEKTFCENICQSWLDRQNHSKSRYWTFYFQISDPSSVKS